MTRTSLLPIAALLCLSAAASAQGRGPGGPPRGGQGGDPGNLGGMVNQFNHSNPRMSVPSSGNDNTSTRGALQLGPSGRWWDNRAFAHTIGINALQQRRMDDVFSANRDTLLKLYKSLQFEESQLEKTSRARDLDETQIFQQIDRVVQARGELEKANAHYLLQIRKEMTPEQTARLDEIRPQLQPAPQ